MEPEHENHLIPSVPESPKGRWTCFLLIGCLSMLYAELFSGASQIWFFNFWSLTVTYPLYLIHVLFFLNVAFRTNKTSPVHLYLWGVLFGMYESWITQVLWVGYDAGGPMIGTGLGIGIGEFLALVFFWHPILSFVLPVLVFEVLALSVPSDVPAEQRVFPSHVPFLVKTKSNQRYIWFLYVAGSLFIAFNYHGSIFHVLAALGGTYVLIYLLFWRARTRSDFSVHSLRVGKVGMGILVVYMAALYTLMFVGYGYFGERIPGLLPVVTTVILYAVFIWIVYSSTPSAESVKIPSQLTVAWFTPSDYRILAIFNIFLASLLCLVVLAVPEFAMIVFLLFYFAMCVIGVYLFYRAIRKRNEQTTESLENQYAFLADTFSRSSDTKNQS